jgi:hypothetical protein
MFWKVRILPIVAAMIASTTLAWASGVTDTARSCAEAVNDPQRLRVHVVSSSTIEAAVLAHARAEVEAIWERYQIEIVWIGESSEGNQEKPDLVVEFIPDMPRHSEAAIAWVLFNAGRPLRLARVSVPAAIRLLDVKSRLDGHPLRTATIGLRELALGRIVGRALAHEIGHFLLASPHHTRSGLMRSMIDAEQFVRPGLASFHLEDAEVRTLRGARLADCELARAIATTAP